MRNESPIVVLGECELSEFAAPLEWLRQRQSLVLLQTSEEAAAHLAVSPCTGQVIAVGRPGQFTATEIETLHALAPMAPVVALVGAWCDGETRSGKPWPGVPRVHWHSWRNAFEQLWGEKPPRRSLWLPRLATDLDRLIAQPPLRRASERELLFVRTASYGLAEVLVAAAEQQGWRAIHVSDKQIASQDAAHAWVWDWSAENADESFRLAEAHAAHPQARLLVLQDFPRPETAYEAWACGAFAVLGKPFSLADMFEALAAVGECPLVKNKTAA